jgi:hypothetical protein
LLAGCLNHHQRDVIDYLQEENRVPREQLGNKRLRLNDEQRRRLAKAVGQCTGRRLFGPNPSGTFYFAANGTSHLAVTV